MVYYILCEYHYSTILFVYVGRSKSNSSLLQNETRIGLFPFPSNTWQMKVYGNLLLNMYICLVVTNSYRERGHANIWVYKCLPLDCALLLLVLRFPSGSVRGGLNSFWVLIHLKTFRNAYLGIHFNDEKSWASFTTCRDTQSDFFGVLNFDVLDQNSVDNIAMHWQLWAWLSSWLIVKQPAYVLQAPNTLFFDLLKLSA